MTATATRGPIARSTAQRMDALKRANAIRSARARMKERLREGLLDPCFLLATPPPFLRTMRVSAFLVALPAFGPVKAKSLMQTVRIAEGKTVGGMSDRQRAALVALLRERSAR